MKTIDLGQDFGTLASIGAISGIAFFGNVMIRIAAFLLVLTMSWGAYAHHSVGVFYESDPSSEISGTSISVDWINPHIRFALESINDENEREVWAVESGSVNMLERNGVGREQLVLGTEITVVGRPLTAHSDPSENATIGP